MRFRVIAYTIPLTQSWPHSHPKTLFYSIFMFQSLQTVNFSYLRHIEPFEFLKIIPYMGQLVTINLHMTLVMDDVSIKFIKLYTQNKITYQHIITFFEHF